jgi:hypothetical protein
VVLRSLSAPTKTTRLGPASSWVPTTLAPQLDRIVLHHEGLVRLLDATGRELVSTSTSLGSVAHAALSPSQRWLALTDGAQIEVLHLDGSGGGGRVSTWPAEGTGYLAWRQDERIVFSGPDPEGPTEAWVPGEGISRADALPEYERGSLDSAWRWSLRSSNRVRRMVDGQEIWFDEAGVLLDDGRFEGTPTALDGLIFRLGDDALGSPMIPPGMMRTVLERDGLSEDFFAGRAVDGQPLRVTDAQRDALAKLAAEDAARARARDREQALRAAAEREAEG